MHTGDKLNECSIGGKSFARSGHVGKYTKEKQYVCDTCGKAFIHVSNLKLHVTIHTEEKPY